MDHTMSADDAATLRRLVLETVIQPGNVHELRVVNFKDRGGRDSGYFNDAGAALAATGPYCREPVIADALYLTPNPVDPRLLARAVNRMNQYAKVTSADADMLRRQFVFVDVDPIRPAGISSTDDEHAAALAVTRDVIDYLGSFLGWPEPVFAGSSGNGGYVWYRVDLPNDDESTALVRGFLAALGGIFDSEAVTIDSTVYNAARIMKLPGTIAAKGDHLEGYDQPDRPWRWSDARFAQYPDAPAVTVDQLGSVGHE